MKEYLIIGIIAAVVLFIKAEKYWKNMEEYSKKEKKYLRSPVNPVASNAELFDTFGYKPELKEEEKEE